MAWETRADPGYVDVILRFQMDEEAQRRVQQGISSLDEELKKFGASAQAEEEAKKATENNIKRLKRLETQAVHTQSEFRRLQFAARSMGDVFTITAAVGTAIFGGATLWATKYVDNVKASTAVVQSWRVATDDLKTSQDRVGAALAEAVLPLLEQAADLAEKAADFVEKNPELLKAVINTAGVVAGLSAIGMAVTKGFKVYADIGYTIATANQVKASAIYEAAAAQQVIAADTMLQAATMQVTGAPLAGVTNAAITGGVVGAAGGAVGVATTAEIAGGLAAVIGAGRVAGLTLNSAGRIISTTSGQFVSTAAANAAAIKAVGVQAEITTGALGQGGLGGVLKNLPLYFFGTQKDIVGTPEQQEFARKQGEQWSTELKAQQEAAGGFWTWLKKMILGDSEVTNAYKELIARQAAEAQASLTAPSTPPYKGPVPGSAEYLDLFAKQNYTLFADYQKQITAATDAYGKQRVALEEQYESQRTDIVAQYAKQRMQADEDYNLSVFRSYRDFNLNEGEIERKYYADRVKLMADTSDKLLEMEQDHQLEMKRMLEDHEMAEDDLVAQYDALGIVRADRAYEVERQRKEEDFAIEVERLNKEAAERLRIAEADFAADRALRLADFQQRLADKWQDFQIERARSLEEEKLRLAELKETHDKQVATLTENYQEQLATLEKSFKDRLRLLDQSILGDYAATQSAIATMILNFRNWLALVASGITASPPPPKGTGWHYGPQATGGYVGYGTYSIEKGKKEFILNDSSTRLAEKLIGGSLNQSNLLAALSQGGGGVGYSDHRVLQFSGVTESDRAAIRRDVYKITREVMVEAFGQ